MEYENQNERDDYNQKEDKLEDAIDKPNLSEVESKDPSLEDGYKILYNKEVPLDLKLETKEGLKEIGSFQQIRFKILSKVDNNEEHTTKIKIELSWENDLLFHYSNIADENTFLELKKNQNLTIDFPKYPEVIQLICEKCIKYPDIYIGEFTIKKEGISQLQFIKVSDFKDLDCLSLKFNNSPDNIIKKHVLYRFSYIKSKLEYNKKALQAAGDVILDCNPDIMNPILDENDKVNLDVDQFFGNKNEENINEKYKNEENKM